MITKLQSNMLKKIALNDYTPINGAVPTRREDAETWQEMIIETSQDKGVFTSLLNKKLVWSNGGGEEAACGLTEDGFQEFLKLMENN